MSIVFQDSLSRQSLAVPHDTTTPISFYACGITPYSDAHIGHARSFVVFDLMRRVLEHDGYTVNLVRNITDVDDKIIAHAAAQNRHWKELAHSFAAQNRQLMSELNVGEYEEPAASEHIPDIIDLVERLIVKGHAYVGENGDVLYSVKSFQGAALMPHDLDDLGHNGARVQHEGKRDNHDFVLWKGAKPNEPSWPSPWGNGRPGWHIECSAMIEKRFGATVDYHGGGTDLRFPHHQAEIQQSEAAYDRPLAHRWVHHGSVRDGKGRKMSKSLGNVVLLKDALAEAEALTPGAGGAVLRHALLSALWTKPLDFWPATTLKTSASHLTQWSKVAQQGTITEQFAERLNAPLRDNLNTPKFFAVLHELSAEAKRGSKEAAAAVYEGLLRLGVSHDAIAALKYEEVIETPQHIQELLNERELHRSNRNFAQADVVRAQLKELGWDVQDKPLKIK